MVRTCNVLRHDLLLSLFRNEYVYTSIVTYDRDSGFKVLCLMCHESCPCSLIRGECQTNPGI